MDSHPSSSLFDLLKAELENEIREAENFLQWVVGRVESRSFDKDKSILNNLILIRKAQEDYIDGIRDEYANKYC